MNYRSSSSAETVKAASDLAKRLRASPPGRSAAVFALEGELGSGKTTFVQGFGRALGSRARILSPTFVLMRRLPLRGRFRNLYHLDAYRLRSERELETLGFREMLADPRNVIVVEWADRVRKLLPRGTKRIFFRHGRHPSERVIRSTPERSRKERARK